MKLDIDGTSNAFNILKNFFSDFWPVENFKATDVKNTANIEIKLENASFTLMFPSNFKR